MYPNPALYKFPCLLNHVIDELYYRDFIHLMKFIFLSNALNRYAS